MKSSLVLPFAPSVLLAYQREVKVRVGRVLEAGSAVDRSGVARSVTRSYVVCGSVQSPYVYVVSLPQLKVVKILKHAYEVAHITLLTVAVKRPTTTAAPTTATTAGNNKSPVKPAAAPSAASSTTSSPAKPTINTSTTTSMRATLHCLTIGGTLYRWDMLDLIAQDGNTAVMPTQPEDESNRELLLTRSKASIIKLPFPSIALPTGILPPTTTDPALSPTSPPPPTTSPLPSLHQQPLFPVACSLSASGNLVLVVMQRELCVYSMVSRSLETPLVSLSAVMGGDVGVREECVFAGCQFLPSFVLLGVLVARVLVWTTTGDVRLLQINTTACEGGGKKVLVEVLANFAINDHTHHLISTTSAAHSATTDSEHKELTITVDGEDGTSRSVSRRQSIAVESSGVDSVPTTFVVDGDRIVGGNAAGELIEWLLPTGLVRHLTAATYTNPFTATDGADESVLKLVSTPTFPTSPITFQLAVHTNSSVLVLPCHRSSIASAFDPSAISQRLSLTSSVTDPCTCSVVLTEGSGKAVLLARGFTSGLIRVYGPGSRSPASPTPSTSTPRTSFSSSAYLPSLSPSSSFSTTQPLSSADGGNGPADATVLDFRAHGAPITALLSIGGREFSCNHCMMASGSADMTVGIWDVSRATLLKRIRLTSAVSSLHKPALTDDDFYYYAAESKGGRGGGGAGRTRGDSGGLHESRIKEEYQHAMDSKPFVTLDAISPRSAAEADNSETDTASQPTSPAPRLRPLVTVEDDSQAAAGLGTLFVSSTDRSVRVYSLSSYLLLQTFRGHDSPVLAVFRDAACMREEQVIVQTERHSVYVWSTVEGTLDLYMRGDEGALPFLQMRGLIAPGSQLSILAHHVRQRMKRMAGGGGGSEGKGGWGESEEEDGDRADGGGDGAGSGSGGGKHDEEKEAVTPSAPSSGSLRDKFHIRSRSFANLGAAHSSSSSGSSSSSTSSSASSSSHKDHTHHIPHIPGFPSSHSTVSSPVHSQHTPSSHSLLHPASSFLSQHRPIDRTTQHALLSSMVKADASSKQHDQHGGGSSSEASHHSDAGSEGGLPPTTPRGSMLSKPNLLKRASTIIEKGADKVRGEMTKERDEGDSHGSSASHSSASATASGSHHSHSTESATFDLHIPLIDPYMGTKKLRHTIDAVRMDGKAHLHVSLFIINLNRFIRDIEKRTLHYQRQHSAPASPRSISVPSTPHAPSINHLAVEALDPDPQSELNYLLSTLFDWDENSATTAMLRQHFQVHSPFPVPCYAAITDNSQAMTVLFPAYCAGWRRWQLDADMTARQALSIAAVCMPLLASADVTSQTYFSKIVAHYGSILPTHLMGYVEPDVSVLALFSVNSNEHVQSSARLLLQGVIERATAERRKEMSELWSTYYTYPIAVDKHSTTTTAAPSPRHKRDTSPTRDSHHTTSSNTSYVSDQEMMTALVLTLIGLTELTHSRHSAADGETAEEAAVREQTLTTFDVVSPHIANTLMRVVGHTGSSHDNDVVKCILAADLLSRSLPLFLPHIGRPETLIQRLYLLSMAKSQSLAATAYRCLLEYGKLDPHSFLSAMGREALSARNNTHVRQSAFQSIIALVKRHSLSLARALPAAVSVCVQALDSKKEPEMRKILMNSSLAALHALDQHYPLVALHHGTQRFAVVSNSPRPTILLYDLNKGDRMRVIEVGKGEVSAVGWSVHGSLIAAYSAVDSPPTVRVWSIAEGTGEAKGGLFGRLMGKASHGSDGGKDGKEKDGGDKCVKVWTLSAIAPPSRTNNYYSAAHSSLGQRWAEDEDKGVKLRRTKSKSQLTAKQPPSRASSPLTVAVGKGSGSASASASPATTPPISPLTLPEEDEGGEVVLPPAGKFDKESGKDVSEASPAAGGSVLSVDEDDEDVVKQLVLKSMLTVKVEWKDDNEVTITRENGDKKSLTL